MSTFVLIAGVTIALVTTLALWITVRTCNERVRAYKSALESNQKRLDHQTSKLNILTSALPNLQTIVIDRPQGDNWTLLALDEARALLRADGASFWKFAERDQTLDCELARGLETNPKEGTTKVGFGRGELGQAAKTRLPVLSADEAITSERRTYLAVPLVVGGNLSGVFRFVRQGGEPISQRDSDLVGMFMRQLALSLENREMVSNREKFYLELVQTLADILDARDASTKGQTLRARSLARATARELDLPEEFIYYLEFAALMHDIGKIGIDEQILKKPGKLTPQEFEIMKKHPEMGHKILAPVSMLAPVAPMVLYHQEWFNGKGYPEGLAGEEIPLGARIVGIIDAWTAMTSDRPWRPALSEDAAIREIRKGAGTQFDPKVVDAFIAAVEKQGIAA